MVEGHSFSDMIPRLPRIAIEGDDARLLMARTPELVAVSIRRVVWRFGFQPGRSLAIATGIYTTTATWVLAVYSGTVLQVYRGAWVDQPPAQFMNVLGAHLEDDRRDFGSVHSGSASLPETRAGTS